MRMLGCLEMTSDRQVCARYVKGVANALAGGIWRWPRDETSHCLRPFRPHIGVRPWTGRNEHCYRSLGLNFIRGSVMESFQRKYASAFRSWVAFYGLMLFQVDGSREDMTWALINFAAWCYE